MPVGVQPDAVDAFDVRGDVAFEQIVDVDRGTPGPLREDSLRLALRSVEAMSRKGLRASTVRGWPH
jgi:hypothetical protein